MSTRATIHFHYDSRDSKPEAIIYRHSDGYPEGLGNDLALFLDEVEKNVKDNRFNDPSYLAAKWIVWDAKQHVEQTNKYDWNKDKKIHYLGFLSVGVCQEDPSNIEYRYHVICKDNNKPEIVVEKI